MHLSIVVVSCCNNRPLKLYSSPHRHLHPLWTFQRCKPPTLLVGGLSIICQCQSHRFKLLKPEASKHSFCDPCGDCQEGCQLLRDLPLHNPLLAALARGRDLRPVVRCRRRRPRFEGSGGGPQGFDGNPRRSSACAEVVPLW